MVSAMIQATKRDDDNVVVLNGKILSGAEARKHARAIFQTIGKVDFEEKIEKCKAINSNTLFCNLRHPIKDESGRTRTAVIVWDKNTSIELIQNTISAMGIDCSKWAELFRLYEQKRKKQTRALGLAVLAVAGIGLALVVMNLK